MQCNHCIVLYWIVSILHCRMQITMQWPMQYNSFTVQYNTSAISAGEKHVEWKNRNQARTKQISSLRRRNPTFFTKEILPPSNFLDISLYGLKMGFGILRWLLQRGRTVESPPVWNLISWSPERKHPLIRVRPNGQSGQRSHFRSLMSKLFLATTVEQRLKR